MGITVQAVLFHISFLGVQIVRYIKLKTLGTPSAAKHSIQVNWIISIYWVLIEKLGKKIYFTKKITKDLRISNFNFTFIVEKKANLITLLF